MLLFLRPSCIQENIKCGTPYMVLLATPPPTTTQSIMPPGAKKRKAAAAKKKKSSTTQSHQGENNNNNNNNGKLNSPTSQHPSVEKIEENSSENKSKDINEKPKNFNSTSSSSSSSSDDESNIIDKNVVVLEPVPETISPIAEPVKPVDSLLDEVSQVFDDIQNDKKKKDLVVVNETVVKDDVACSTVMKDVSSEVNGANRVNETDTVGEYNKQAPVASTAVAVQRTTTWKSCCGIFELFSGSERN